MKRSFTAAAGKRSWEGASLESELLLSPKDKHQIWLFNSKKITSKTYQSIKILFKVLAITSTSRSSTNLIIMLPRFGPKWKHWAQEQPMKFSFYIFCPDTISLWTMTLPPSISMFLQLCSQSYVSSLETYLSLLGNIIHVCWMQSQGVFGVLYVFAPEKIY